MSGSLANPVAEVIYQLLLDLGIGNVDWPVYIESEPDSPDDVITVYDTAGNLLGSTMINGEVVEQHGIQVRVRSSLYSPGHRVIDSIKHKFDTQVKRTLVTVEEDDGDKVYRIHSLDRTSGPFHIGTEDTASKRDLFTINYVCTLRQVS